MRGGGGGGDPHHKAGGRDDTVIYAEDGGAEPSYPCDQMTLGMEMSHGSALKVVASVAKQTALGKVAEERPRQTAEHPLPEARMGVAAGHDKFGATLLRRQQQLGRN